MPLDARPRLPRSARVQFDDVRQQKVLLYPEGAVLLNGTGAAILELCDGKRTIAEIAAQLGATYGADVADDVAAYLSQLADRELIHDARA
jgi:pyrroloquinoline quinone biosynthesis protein D